jgi:hypothetical protein
MIGRTLQIELPMPPGLNNSYANVAGRGRVATKALRSWKKAASAEIASQARSTKFIGTYTVSIRASDQVLPTRRDADGLAKAVPIYDSEAVSRQLRALFEGAGIQFRDDGISHPRE